MLVIEEDQIDGVSHSDHVHLSARTDPQSVSWFQATRPEQAAHARPMRVRELEVIGDHRTRVCVGCPV